MYLCVCVCVLCAFHTYCNTHFVRELEASNTNYSVAEAKLGVQLDGVILHAIMYLNLNCIK